MWSEIAARRSEVAGERQPRVADRVVERLARDLSSPRAAAGGRCPGSRAAARRGSVIAAATRSMPNPATPSIRCARFIATSRSGSAGCPRRRRRAPRRRAAPSPSSARSRRRPSSIGASAGPTRTGADVDVQQLLDPERMRRRCARRARDGTGSRTARRAARAGRSARAGARRARRPRRGRPRRCGRRAAPSCGASRSEESGTPSASASAYSVSTVGFPSPRSSAAIVLRATPERRRARGREVSPRSAFRFAAHCDAHSCILRCAARAPINGGR